MWYASGVVTVVWRNGSVGRTQAALAIPVRVSVSVRMSVPFFLVLAVGLDCGKAALFLRERKLVAIHARCLATWPSKSQVSLKLVVADLEVQLAKFQSGACAVLQLLHLLPMFLLSLHIRDCSSACMFQQKQKWTAAESRASDSVDSCGCVCACACTKCEWRVDALVGGNKNLRVESGCGDDARWNMLTKCAFEAKLQCTGFFSDPAMMMCAIFASSTVFF